MTPAEFHSLLEAPKAMGPALEALWLDAKGRWGEAHRAVQEDASAEAAWVHAYLHRKEGDRSNARYWYARAGKPEAQGPLEDEAEAILRALLPD